MNKIRSGEVKRLLLAAGLIFAANNFAHADRSIKTGTGSISTVTVNGVAVGYGLVSVTTSGGIILSLDPNATGYIANSATTQSGKTINLSSAGIQTLYLGQAISTGNWILNGTTFSLNAAVSTGTITDTSTRTFVNGEFSGTRNDNSVVTLIGEVENGTRTDNSTTTYTGIQNIRGATDGSSAATGNYAEEVSSVGTSAHPYGLTTNVYIDVATMTIPAGDWLVYGAVEFVTSSNPTGTALVAVLTTNGGSSTAGQFNADNLSQVPTMPTTACDVVLPIPLPQHIVLSSPTAYYLKAEATFSAGNVKTFGNIRRVRNPH